MATILITNSVPTDPILRQIPQRGSSWCRHRFVLEATNEPIDAWVVYDNLLKPATNRIERSRTILVTGEPPSIRRYRSVFTSQFGAVRTCQPNVEHPHLVRAHEAQPWHFGMHRCRSHPQILDYDALVVMSAPSKKKLLSVIASNKTMTEDHRQRLRFVEELKSAFGDQIDVFGRGIRDVPDKADAIWDYRCHIVLENDHSEYYMSEKLPDSFLGWSYPFYSGGAFADSVFPKGSFGRIDMYDPRRSIATIRAHLENQDRVQSLELIAKARLIVLDELNLFSVLGKYYDAMALRLQRTESTLNRNPKPTTLFPKKNSVQLSIRRFIRALSMAS